MKKITVNITFTGATGGQGHVVIQSASSNFNYDVNGASGPDQRDFHVNTGLYTIKIHGSTGGSCNLTVTGDIDSPVNANAQGPNIFIQQQFIVQ
jgi:hypothetical protein